MNNYTDLTDEEYDALDEELTRNPPEIICDGSNWLTQREMYKLSYSNMTVQYLLTKAKVVNKSPEEIINELVSKELAAAAM